MIKLDFKFWVLVHSFSTSYLDTECSMDNKHPDTDIGVRHDDLKNKTAKLLESFTSVKYSD